MTTRQEQLRAAAVKANVIDPDDALALLEDDGTTGADQLMTRFKAAKPFLFQKHMRDMTPAEQNEWWREHAKRFPGGAPRPGPMPLDKRASEMTPRERDAFLKECARRFG
jgi:hypothetical protein